MYHRAEISAPFGFQSWLVDHKEADDADTDDYGADDGKNAGPAFGQIEIKRHKAAENGKNGNERHHGVDALGSAAVGMIRAVRQPGVEGGIVCT